jgi:hypothetical protein
MKIKMSLESDLSSFSESLTLTFDLKDPDELEYIKMSFRFMLDKHLDKAKRNIDDPQNTPNLTL